jgi:enamine deaminase RidA (YjgF/YER057c/UK114 family)
MTVERFNPPTLLKPHGYAHAVAVTGGTTIYLSGQVPADVEGTLVGAGDYAAQAEQAMLNLNHAIEGAGGSAKDLVKLTVYVVDHTEEHEAIAMKGFAAAARATSLGPVATMLIGVTALGLPGALIEVDGIAVINAN